YQNMAKLRSVARLLVIQVAHVIVSSILKWYFEFFLRVINFISRKREFRADELACLLVGTEPMHEGLKKIHAGEFAWHAYFHAEVQSLIRKGVMPPIGEGFRRFLAAPSVVTSFENVLANEITEGKTEPYDSHPPLVERLAAIKKMPQGLNGHALESALELLEN